MAAGWEATSGSRKVNRITQKGKLGGGRNGWLEWRKRRTGKKHGEVGAD